MLKAALIGNPARIDEVYSGGRKERLASEFTLYPEVLGVDMLRDRSAGLKDIQFLFSTWGMPALTGEQIARLPSLRALFYAAGTVQKFARPFLECGVKVFSAWAANAVPVAEYTVAHVLLANTGYLRATRTTCSPQAWRERDTASFPGNFDTTVALLGAGAIGRAVIERLKPYAVDVIVFDPFLPDDAAAELHIEKVSLEEAFRRGFVVSNHLANLPATKGMLRGELFASMQPNAVFINTGRGATVDEPAMIRVLEERPDLMAVLDVTHPEPPAESSPLYTLDNVILTPHIAGAKSHEVRRLADYMIDEAIALRDGRPTQYEVTANMLSTMA